ncbi:proton channel OtopLc-like [Penaeus indicus]|uniref:proton channel OtopLc-like n=1 Tax=Penaeus indicus TaxID=29960 RepID=UPI00300D739D
MKIQTDLESQGDKMASRYLRSKGIRVPPPRHRSFGETVVNISAGEVDCEYVSENESREFNNSFNQSDAGEGGGRGRAEFLGHENLAFVEDEQDAISQEENFASPEEPDAGPVELPRRSSDPEVSSSAKSDEVKAEEELFRSASCGTELDKVLNNLSGEQSPVSGTPTLRKRSISRGRQESIHSEPDDTKTKEETPDSAKWVGVHGGQPSEGAQSASPLLTSPTTPHIVVSPEENANSQNANDKPVQEDAAQQQSSPQANNGTGVPNGQSALASQPTPAVEEKERTRPDKLTLTMNTLDLPDSRHPSLDIGVRRNTRRNSMSEMLKRYGSQTNLQRTPSTNNIRRSTSRNSLVLEWTQEGNDSLIACLSALYGKLLVVMGMAFPIAEVISHDIPVTFYNGFYLYLYIGSIIFLVYAYMFLLRAINLPTEQIKSKFHSLRNYMAMPDLHMVFPHRNSSQQEGTGRMASRESHLSGGSELDKESDRASVNTMSFKPAKYTLTESNNHGSMYLKMGAVLFGIGSMIYSGLEVGQYFELKGDDNCADILLAIAPGARMLFTFIQMYFIFLNSRVAISRHRIVARFGLMHMIGTNLCIWLNVLVQETKHEIINLKLGHGQHHGGGNLWALILSEGELVSLYFILISKFHDKRLISFYLLASVASVTVVIGMIQMRELEFIPEGDIELDNILLLIAQTGVYIYTSFTVIGGHFTMTDNLILPLLSSIVTLIQTTLQTIFILDASRRCCYNHDQLQRKPGREMVTFLLVCNLAMWAINTFETSRADAHPTQLNFYGIWAWTIISHVSMPLAIFYRFHVTVCLCEIWKRSYKLKNDY